ncbi:hypothetical protein [Akkermansia sp.]|uniref:hypothetical protein n=1 Tax=Akkermansia sp. TaxID=1872421 RepID=UPI0025BA10BF|nr:hypothetical protein [Akkermansia sp.]MCC8147581.1 hypothetical protein [Akkermansia sp.]
MTSVFVPIFFLFVVMPVVYCSGFIEHGLSSCANYNNIDEDASWKYRYIPSWEDRYENWAGVIENYNRPIRPNTAWRIIDQEFPYWINSDHIESFVELYNHTYSSDEKNELKLVLQEIASNWNENSHVEAFKKGKKSWEKSLLPRDCWDMDPQTLNETRRKVRDKIQKLIRQGRHLEAADALFAWRRILPNIYDLYQELEKSWQRRMIKNIFHFHDREKQYEQTFCRYQLNLFGDLKQKDVVSETFLYSWAPHIRKKNIISRYCVSALNHLAETQALSSERKKALQHLKSKRADLFDDSHIKFKQQIIADINRSIALSESKLTWEIDTAALILYQVAWTLDDAELKDIKERYMSALKKLKVVLTAE